MKIADIKFVQQPTSVTCTHACLSMVTGRHVDELIQRFGNHGIGSEAEAALLTECGFMPVHMNRYAESYFPAIGLYLMSAPSLNIQGAMHRLVVLMDDNWDLFVLDPNTGRKGKKYYARNAFFSKRGISYADIVHCVPMRLHKGEE